MRRGIAWLTALALSALFMSQTLVWFRAQSTPVISPIITGRAESLILDAGHGGEDGGAVSVTGIPESRINLAIVLKLNDILGLYGTAPILLRQEDISLHDSSAVTIREKKVSDLKNRVSAIQAVPGAVLVSIHQNSYPNGRYRGAQVFYAPTQGSPELARHMQEAIQKTIQPENSRQAKKIPDTVYLMNHISCPAVLVECGFLTNGEEEAMLREDAYQRKLAAVLASAWLTFSSQPDGPQSGETG